MNARKSKVKVFDRREVEMMGFNSCNRVNVPAIERYEVVLGEEMKKVKKLKYL